MRAKGAWARATGAGLAMLSSSVGGCIGADAFLCESDASCQQGGVQGLCQPSGYCSFPDGACPSGQRYGQHADDTLANTCVEPEPLTSDGSTSDPSGLTTTSTTTTSGPTTLTTAPISTGLDDDVTTEPVDPSSPGTSTDPTSGGMADDDPGTTTGSTNEVVCWTDEFDDGVIDDAVWCEWTGPGLAVDELRGHLRVQLLPDQWGMRGATGGVSTCEPFMLLGAEAAVEVLAVPQVSPFTEAYIEMGLPDLRLGLGVLDAQLYAFTYDGANYSAFAWQPYDPVAHRWLRIVGTGEGLVAERSADGVGWAYVHELPADLMVAEGTASLGAWGAMVPLGPDEATFERFELCTVVL